MGALDYFSNFCSVASTRKKRKPMQTVEIKVKMDCDGCERRVKNAVKNMKGGTTTQSWVCMGCCREVVALSPLNLHIYVLRGVRTFEINRKQHRVTVSGYLDPNKVLKRVKSTGKRAEFWPYIPHNLVQHPYVAQAYDRKAPSGFVRNVQMPTAPHEERITYFFSDDNPNACSIM